MAEAALTCPRCAAPLEVTPETIVAICKYCGFPRIIAGTFRLDEVRIVGSRDRSQIVDSFWRSVKKDPDLRRYGDKITLVDIEGFYIPAWIGEVRIEGKLTHRNKSKAFSFTTGVGFCARRAVMTFGVMDVIYHFLQSRPLSKPLTEISKDEWETMKLKVLSTELDRSEVRERMLEDAIDIVRSAYEEKKTLSYFSANASFAEEPVLILLPMWVVHYRCRRGCFRAAFAGWDGKRVAATEPMSLPHRVKYTLSAIGLTAAASFVGGALYYIILNFSNSASTRSRGKTILFLLALLFAIYTAVLKLGQLAVRGSRTEYSVRLRVKTARGTVLERMG